MYNKDKFLVPDIFNKLKAFDENHKFNGIVVFPDKTKTQRDDINILKAEAVEKNEELRVAGDLTHKWKIRGQRLKYCLIISNPHT